MLEQLRIIILFIALGIFMSIMIDFIDLFRSKNKVLTFILQIVLWFIVAIIVCKFVLNISKGYLPIYTFLFFILGYIIYRYLFRKKLVVSFKKIKKVFLEKRGFFSMLLLPKELYKFILKTFKKLFKRIKPIIKRKKKEEIIEA